MAHRRQCAHRRQRADRRGFTLVELLVVVAMLIILVSVLTAAMQPVLSGKEIREAARQLNAFIAGSVARAARTGRPSGIWLERDASNPNAVFEVFYADVPPVYAGDFTNSSVSVVRNTPLSTLTFDGVSPLLGADNTPNTPDDLIRLGDFIQFNYSGPWYRIVTVTSNTEATFTFLDPTFTYIEKVPPPVDYVNVPFQIRRQPRKSPLKPLQLPANTVIDLANSGIGLGPQKDVFKSGTAPVAITFLPNGSIDNLLMNWVSSPAAGTVHLLIGRPGDQIGAGNLGTGPNDNRWVSINHQTGRVVTTENMGVDIVTARQFAKTGQGMGGGS